MATPALKIKKKNWHTVYAPKMFEDAPIGETFVDDITASIGRCITVSMMTLTNDPKRQSTYLTFKMSEKKHDGLGTTLVGMDMMPGAIKRMIKRNRERIDDSFTIITTDGLAVRLKPISVTRGHCTHVVTRAIHQKVREFFAMEATKMTYDNLCYEILSHNFQKQIQDYVNSTYPISVCEIRKMKLLGPAAGFTKIPGLLAAKAKKAETRKEKKKEGEESEEEEQAEKEQQ